MMDLTNEHHFPKSNEMYKAMTKELKRQGKGGLDSHPPIQDDDLKLLANYFEKNIRDNPRVLQEKVFVDIMVHFGRRGRENLRNLKQMDFAVTTSIETKEMFVYKCRDEATKNHQDDLGDKTGKMFEIKGTYISIFKLKKFP